MNPPNPSEDPKHPNAVSGDNPTTVIPSIAARPDGLTDEEWGLIESRRENQKSRPAPDSRPTSNGGDAQYQWPQLTPKRSEPPNNRSKIIAIGIVTLVIACAGFFAAMSMGGNNTKSETTTTAAPKVEAIDTSQPITLTSEQISQLQAGGAAPHKIFNKELVPRLDAIIKEGIANGGVVSPDNQGISLLTNSMANAEGVANTLGQISQRFSPAGNQQDFAVVDTDGGAVFTLSGYHKNTSGTASILRLKFSG